MELQSVQVRNKNPHPVGHFAPPRLRVNPSVVSDSAWAAFTLQILPNEPIFASEKARDPAPSRFIPASGEKIYLRLGRRFPQQCKTGSPEKNKFCQTKPSVCKRLVKKYLWERGRQNVAPGGLPIPIDVGAVHCYNVVTMFLKINFSR